MLHQPRGTMKTHFIPRKALRIDSVIERTGVSKTHLYRMINSGKFPRPVKLSERVSAWDADLVDSWLKSKFDGVQS
jgi:prophage regulatory protein